MNDDCTRDETIGGAKRVRAVEWKKAEHRKIVNELLWGCWKNERYGRILLQIQLKWFRWIKFVRKRDIDDFNVAMAMLWFALVFIYFIINSFFFFFFSFAYNHNWLGYHSRFTIQTLIDAPVVCECECECEW